ncbi:hypothetical protein NT07LI_3493 [Listeria innocua FSL S4-378]|nr:hypothetical protein NT07LI_3493 [Listeria innocua FSL S4-378]
MPLLIQLVLLKKRRLNLYLELLEKAHWHSDLQLPNLYSFVIP